jgi:uncharacterized protein
MLDRLFDLTVIVSLKYPRRIFYTTALLTLALLCSFPFVKVDVDPENMLSATEPVRVFHNAMKKKMDLYDMTLVGISRDNHRDGVFNPESLSRIFELSKFLQTLDELVTKHIMTPSTLDAIEPGPTPATLAFTRLMQSPPKTREGSLMVRDRARSNPFLLGTMLSEDGKALALYLPQKSKDLSFQTARKLQEKIKALGGPEKYYITGLSLAEDSFGNEMFRQMSISAPLALGLITVLMLILFKNFQIVAGSILTAIASISITLGLFILSGQTLHIMSSMIPIFILPIAVLDDIHILSQFYDRYNGNSREALVETLKDLWKPMAFTSLTSAAGFFSLALAPIPPVQVFGIFTAIGILVAWLLSMTFLPAFIERIPEKSLKRFGSRFESAQGGMLDKALRSSQKLTWNYAHIILVLFLILSLGAGFGILGIEVNDNPIKWFQKDHPLRLADAEVNRRFGGSYTLFLAFSQVFPDSGTSSKDEELQYLNLSLGKFSHEGESLVSDLSTLANQTKTPLEFLNQVRAKVQIFKAQSAHSAHFDPRAVQRWKDIDSLVAKRLEPYQIFMQPEMLTWLDWLLGHLFSMDLVSRGNTPVDLVKKINQDLHGGDPSHFQIPGTSLEVLAAYEGFKGSHDPYRLWTIVTQDLSEANIWVQLKSGDNLDVSRVVEKAESWIVKNPPPIKLKHGWYGLSYINTIWQKKMVGGMLKALCGSALVIFILLILFLGSLRWALLSMLPLSLSMCVIYGTIGILGKDYDMPVAVISALALGLAIDFAIHFVTYAKSYSTLGLSPRETLDRIFEEPARGISRNAIVVALGFTPLIFSPLVPYQTTGYLMLGILGTSAVATLVILPACLRLGARFLYPRSD